MPSINPDYILVLLFDSVRFKTKKAVQIKLHSVCYAELGFI